MRQVFVVHGGMDHKRYEDYLNYLKTVELDPLRVSGKSWKSRLPEDLEPEYQVVAPKMPNPDNAKYAEWKLWFERHMPFLEDGIILLGHSLGAIFLVRYLADNDFPKQVAATLLIAPPFDLDDTNDTWDFTVPKDFSKLTAQGGRIIFYHSKDDTVVPFAELAKYQRVLPDATYKVFEDRGHFFAQESFPELVADIKALP